MQSYDYVVIGGETAGLVLAARLSENPDIKVSVLEAGANRIDDKQVPMPSLYPTLIGPFLLQRIIEGTVGKLQRGICKAIIPSQVM